MSFILTKNLTIFEVQAEDSDAYHVIEKDVENGDIILIFKDEVIYEGDTFDDVDIHKLKVSIDIPNKFLENIDLIQKILSQSPFKPYYPTHYDIINDTYVCEHEDGNTYVYDTNICEYINESKLLNDHLYSKDAFFRVDFESLADIVNKHNFENYFKSLNDEEKDGIINDVSNLYVIKVKDFIKPFIAHRVHCNKKSNYFDHEKGYFYVRRGDGTEYKYNIDQLESYIHIYDFNSSTDEGDENE